MASDEQVIVLGGGSDTSSPPPTDPAPSRPSFWLLSPVIGVIALVIVFVVIPQDEPETATDPGGLEAPEEPPSAFVNSDAPSEEVAAYGGRKVDLYGAGVVSSVEHGPDGWLAVSAGAPVVVHRSENAVLWEPSTIHGLEAGEPIGAVGDGVIAVFGSRQFSSSAGAFAVGAISDDGGSSWTLVEHSGLIVVRDVAVVDGHIYVVGQTGDEPGFGWNGGGTSSLWEVVDDRLESIPLDAAPPGSELNSIVQTNAGVMIYGKSDGGPARWSVEGERQLLILPSDLASRGFVSVIPSGSRLMALVGTSVVNGGFTIWESDDGFEWRETIDAIGASLRQFALTDDGIVGPAVDSDRVWLGSRGSTGIGEMYGAPGQVQAWMASVAAADGVTVFGGSGLTDPMLIVHGTTVHPVEVAPTPRTDGNGWQPELTIDLRMEGLGGMAWPQGSMVAGDKLLFVTTATVFEIDTSSRGLLVTPVIENPYTFGYGESGAWVVAHESGRTMLHRLDDSGQWTVEPSPVEDVGWVGTFEGAPALTGWSRSGFTLYRQGSDGQWTSLGQASIDDVVIPAGEVLLAPGDPYAADPGLRSVRISRDGQSWEEVDGWTVDWGFGSHPFLRSTEDASVVSMPEELPDVAPVKIPSAAEYLRIWPWNGGLIVQDPWFLHLPDGDGGWRSLPLDIEHGVTGDVTALPGETPRIAVVNEGSLTFLSWR